jgi:hypothetical protein
MCDVIALASADNDFVVIVVLVFVVVVVVVIVIVPRVDVDARSSMDVATVVALSAFPSIPSMAEPVISILVVAHVVVSDVAIAIDLAFLVRGVGCKQRASPRARSSRSSASHPS